MTRPHMPAPTTKDDHAHDFIQRWSGTTASELATAQSFVMDLCQLLGVDKPHATPEQSYMFERPVTFAHGDGSTSAGRIDCYLASARLREESNVHTVISEQSVTLGRHLNTARTAV